MYTSVIILFFLWARKMPKMSAEFAPAKYCTILALLQDDSLYLAVVGSRPVYWVSLLFFNTLSTNEALRTSDRFQTASSRLHYPMSKVLPAVLIFLDLRSTSPKRYGRCHRAHSPGTDMPGSLLCAFWPGMRWNARALWSIRWRCSLPHRDLDLSVPRCCVQV